MGSQPGNEISHASPLRLLITGGTGVLGRALRPLAEAQATRSAMPTHEELDLFDPAAVAAAVRDVDVVLHLATRIAPIRADLQPGGVARERPAPRRRIEDPRRCRHRGRCGGLRPTDRHLRLPAQRSRITRTRLSARCPRSCAPRSPPSRRPCASRAPVDAVSYFDSGCSTARVPATTSQ